MKLPASESYNETAQLRVVGRVEGVGFEEFATHYARRLGLHGRYESLGDGVLRITLCGRRALIEMFETACWLGPRQAQVDTLETSFEVRPNDRYNEFRIERAGDVSAPRTPPVRAEKLLSPDCNRS